ncbi:MAG: Dabb family protein [Acidimicrobiia bacterium]
MIRHIALFKFTDDVTPDGIDTLDTTLRGLPASIDAIEAYTCGRDLGILDGNWDYAVVADFASVEAYHEYANHPDHVAASVNVAKPMMAQSMRVQFASD